MHLDDDGDPCSALRVDLGNPHTVVALPEAVDLDSLDLTRAPQVRPEPPHGTNVELVRPMGPGHIAMRVHERGVGETRSCGTGACAAAIATSFWAGRPRHRRHVAGRRTRGPADACGCCPTTASSWPGRPCWSPTARSTALLPD